MELYLFFHEVVHGGDFDTLYKIKLPSLPMSEVKPKEAAERVSPILKLPGDKYPYSMGCVHFDSKIYFLGGLSCNPYDIEDDEENIGHDFTDHVYPGGAYVLDLTDNDQVLKKLPSMTTGKPRTFGFVADGMIYVIGGKVERTLTSSDNLIKCFERFNPVDMTWQVLDDTPLRGLHQWLRASVIENQHKVLIVGMKGNDFILLIYDFLYDRWDPEHLLLPNYPRRMQYTISHISANGGRLYLYGLRPSASCPHPIKLGPLKQLEIDQMRELSLVDVSTHDSPKEWNAQAFFRRMALCSHNRMLYLGDGHLCYLGVGQPEAGDFGDDFCGPCPQTRYVSLTIFRDISNPVELLLEDSSFEAKILCIKDYEMNTSYHGGVFIGAYFIVGG